MGEAGLFANERVELLDGTIVTMSPQSSPHAATVARLTRVLIGTLGEKIHVRPQLPVVLDDWSEPEPDLIVCRADSRDYAQGHPQPEDIMLICEVAISSLAYDRTAKTAAYAASGIPEYWIVDVESRVVIVLDDPDPATRRYRRERRVDDVGIVEAPGGTTLAVAQILPPL
jgi:Uma2 family endonuclease